MPSNRASSAHRPRCIRTDPIRPSRPMTDASCLIGPCQLGAERPQVCLPARALDLDIDASAAPGNHRAGPTELSGDLYRLKRSELRRALADAVWFGVN